MLRKNKNTQWMIGGLVMMLIGITMWVRTPAAAFAKDGPETQEYRGLLTSRPAGTAGTWVVGSRSFVADGNTELNEVEGALTVGACAKVRFVSSNGVDVADEIDSEPAGDCGVNGTATPSVSGTPIGTPSASPSPSSTSAPNEPQIVRGLLTSRPAGTAGIWVVGSRSFVADGNTELDEVEGALTVGACVKVRFVSSNGVDVADEIDSEPAEDCNLSGTATTTPAPGGTPSGTPSASPSPSSTPVPQPTRDAHEDSKVFAKVDALPASPFTGTWSIGGSVYVADSATEFEQKDGAFAVGVCVKAEFSNVNGVNVLEEVETEDSRKCEEDSSGGPRNNFKAYGVIDAFTTTAPSNWVVSGISYTVDANTKLEQNHGVFAVGAFVEVKYVVSDTSRTATKIEMHVAPGTGNDNKVGVLNSRPSDDWGTWVINGVSYQGDPAIVVELPAAALEAKALSVNSASAAPLLVQVNAYVSNGTNFATLVRGLGNSIYLPVMQR